MQWIYSEDDSFQRQERVWDAEALAGTWRTEDGRVEVVLSNENNEVMVESALATFIHEYVDLENDVIFGEKKEIELTFDKIAETRFDSAGSIYFNTSECEEKYGIDENDIYVLFLEDGVFFKADRNEVQLFKVE